MSQIRYARLTTNARLRQAQKLASTAAAVFTCSTLSFAQELPAPFALASQLDLECHAAAGAPPVQNLFIRQLNPVIRDELPDQQAALGPLEEVCVPVAKNNQVPGPGVLPIARWVDLACYGAQAAPVELDVTLSHLNPVLAGLPDEDVKLAELEQLCVPVRKNASVIPEPVERIVKHFDFACYGLREPTEPANVPLELDHLNPVIREMQLADRRVSMRRARQLCVPVAKNEEPVPPAVRELVSWVDFLKYDVVPVNAEAVAAVQAPIPLWLTHLNPLLDDAPPFFTVLTAPLKLLVPVAKDGVLPPGGPAGD